MRERYEGDKGRPLLIAALQDQRVIEHDEALATLVAEKGTLAEFKSGDVMIEQGNSDTDVYFLLDGLVEVKVNGRVVAQRKPGESLGEMVLVDVTARRSATITALKPCLALKLDEPAFTEVAKQFPKLWRPIAKVVAARLREREKFHHVPNPCPVLFVGSSVEGLPVAKELILGLKHDNVTVRLWSLPGIFSPGGVTIDVLLREVDGADFAAFVFGPDDKVTSRDEKYLAPRDNVVFELGLFMGRLDRTRTFVIKDQRADVKIPTDLLGVTPVTYVRKPNEELSVTMASVSVELAKLIKQIGCR